MVKKLPPDIGDAGDVSSVHGFGISPEGRHGNPLQYSDLQNPMGRGAWLARVHGVSQSRTRLSMRVAHAAAAAELLQSCPTLCDTIDSSPPAPSSLGFSRQEHWSGLPIHIYKSMYLNI